MNQYVMEGGSPLVGDVFISGAKNAALGIIAAAIMTEEDVILDNLPDVNDINVMLEAIAAIGAKVEKLGHNTVKINAKNLTGVEIDDDFIRKIRASYYFIGALLGRYKSACVPLPGGCAIGSRPIDQHLKGFRALGANVDTTGGFVNAHAIDLVGSHIYLDVVSVGATINIMMAAALAEGKTVIENVAKEPHIVDVANFLNSMGANIKGAGTDLIRIEGVRSLHGSEYSIIPDQIEAGTFMCAAAITRGDVTVRNIIPKHQGSARPQIRRFHTGSVKALDAADQGNIALHFDVGSHPGELIHILKAVLENTLHHRTGSVCQSQRRGHLRLHIRREARIR